MTLIRFDQVYLSYAVVPLLDHAELNIQPNERVCLIGQNGMGKSTLFKVLSGEVMPDSGHVWRKPNIRIAMLNQQPPAISHQTIWDYVATGLEDIGNYLKEYHHLTLQTEHNDAYFANLERLQHEIESRNGWQYQQRIDAMLSRLALPPDLTLDKLSGGWRRRVDLARALVTEPDLLLLDEPTNHLDIETITWLEDALLNYGGSVLFITHDRSFIQKLATRIIELDRGHLTSWSCDYETYLVRKEAKLMEEERHNQLFDKKLAEEEVWIRQGIKARRTRNEGRVRALEALREERQRRRELRQQPAFTATLGASSGQLVVEAEHIHHHLDGASLIQDFSITIQRGDRIGLIGPNGCGKTTLLKILLTELQPTRGSVRLGTSLEIAYFDQMRSKIDPNKTAIENVAEESESVVVDGKHRHIISYLGDFLFTPERARIKAKALSGGECNRLMLARLFCRPVNMLVLDEPTNDLDIESLELLETLLLNFKGTLLLVSHDRTFIDHIVTSSIVFEGNGVVKEYVGGYTDYCRQRTIPAPSKALEKKKGVEPHPSTQNQATVKPSKQHARELEKILKQIEKIEEKQKQLHSKMAEPNFYDSDFDTQQRTLTELKAFEEQLEKLYSEWEKLN